MFVDERAVLTADGNRSRLNDARPTTMAALLRLSSLSDGSAALSAKIHRTVRFDLYITMQKFEDQTEDSVKIKS